MRRERPRARAWLSLLCVGAICGCDEPARYECRRVGEPVRVGPDFGTHQIAKADGALFWTQAGSESWTGQWADPSSGEALSAPLDMGSGDGSRPFWLPDGAGGLVGVLDSTVGPGPLDAQDYYGVWRVGIGESSRVPVPLDVPSDCDRCVREGGGGAHGGHSAVSVGGRRLAVIATADPRCVAIGATALSRVLRIVDLEDGTSVPVYVADECATVTTPNLLDVLVDSPWAVALSDGNLGILYSHPLGITPRRYVVVSPEGRVIHPPRVVGSDIFRDSRRQYPQGRAARVGDHVIFVEGDVMDSICSRIRVMNEDGTGARDASWQPTCGSATWFHVQAMGDHVGILYSIVYVTDDSTTLEDARYDSAAAFVLLDEHGRLVSEQIFASPLEAASTVAPSRSFLLPLLTSLWVGPQEADAEELTATVSYLDRRSEPPGLFIQEIACQAEAQR